MQSESPETPQPARRGRGRPRKYPLPEGTKPKPSGPKKTNGLDIDMNLDMTIDARPRRARTTKKVVYEEDTGGIEDDGVFMDVDDNSADDAEFDSGKDESEDDLVEDDLVSEDDYAAPARTRKRTSAPPPIRSKYDGSAPTRAELEEEILKMKTWVPVFQTKSGPNFKARLLRYHGLNTDIIAKIVKAQNRWKVFGTHLSDQLCSEVEVFPEEFEILDIPFALTKGIDEQTFYETLHIGGDLGIAFNNETVQQLRIFESIEIPTAGIRHGRIVNSGALPLELSWMKSGLPESAFQYLFVSIMPRTKGVVHEEISFLSDMVQTSGLLIYRVGTSDFSTELVKVVTIPFGVMRNMKWSAGLTQSNTCLLGACFSDGSCRIFNFDTTIFEEPKLALELTEASVTFKLPGQKITSFDWISESRVLVGTSDGSIAEFSLFEEAPSYVYQLNLNAITGVTSNISDFVHTSADRRQKQQEIKCNVVFLTTLDFVNVVLNLNSLTYEEVGIAPKILSRQVTYSPLIDMFVYEDGSYTVKAVPKKLPSLSYPLVGHDSVASAVASSILHPLLLTSSSDGTLMIFNPTPKLSAPAKSSAVSVCAQILKLDYNDSLKAFRISTAQELIAAKKENARFYVELFPAGVNLHCIAWNQNPTAGSWYAACSSSGLLVIEKIASAEIQSV